ncbi:MULTISPECIES: DUF1593 domain-containing protein [unclassified Imperialibacter]|uniref:DUF1593 domain-containing protein n=1 Tax=unclassified Imperialibacter TaxID=2629706 RepID=UPI001251D254|nr:MULTISPECIES: DUF1593 domain-containing protein [unclassified Imperialibacter]CAD5284786.1 conserved hypothetical protein [Imperialibacter sp. 89]CAD5285569.1 conserved hypothetical protein [Imperialibacter sp. 75]VVT28011.1 Inosine-uridine nucleoside N-ribohydrolase [Imperialibacter sp. EC-SDR9]
MRTYYDNSMKAKMPSRDFLKIPASKLLFLVLIISIAFLSDCNDTNADYEAPNIIVSTDIGGSDPDDYQSLVHLFLYADRFNLLGLISSPPDAGRKEHIEESIAAYAVDFEKLKEHSVLFPTPEYLLSITKQGATDSLKTEVPTELSDGASWIIDKAKENAGQPLYILVWGSITDVAQAVHHAPSIKSNIRVYSIGSWNTVQDPKSRDYLFNNHSDLWWIENNTTFRGMYMGGDTTNSMGNLTFVESHLKGHGALGEFFWEKKKDIKMGDTPSVLYFLNGDIDNPEGESWGGSFIKTDHGPHYWTDNPADSLIEINRAGAKTVNKFRQAYLRDWAARMGWLKE